MMKRFPCELAVLVAVTVSLIHMEAGVSIGQELTVVVPSHLENREGNDSSGVSTAGFRRQHIYLASGFDTVPEGGAWLVGHAYRADASQSEEVPTSFNDVKVTLSTTNLSTISPNFGINLGESSVTVLEGSVDLNYPISGPAGGPNPFGDEYAYTTPFFYDPSQGNLIVEIVTQTGPETRGATDWATTPDGFAGTAYNAFWQATHGATILTRPITQFRFVPEPSSGLLLGLGMMSLVFWRRQRQFVKTLL